MSTLVVIGYDDEAKAEVMRGNLLKLQREYMVDLEDAVVVVRDQKGKVKLHQIVSLPARGDREGGNCGTLIGCGFFSPLFGMTLGAATGALSGALADVGINDDFMKQLGETLKPGCSALCVLIRQMTPDKVLAELQGAGGTILQTNLSKQEEAKLQEALSAARKAHAEANASVTA